MHLAGNAPLNTSMKQSEHAVYLAKQGLIPTLVVFLSQQRQQRVSIPLHTVRLTAAPTSSTMGWTPCSNSNSNRASQEGMISTKIPILPAYQCHENLLLHFQDEEPASRKRHTRPLGCPLSTRSSFRQLSVSTLSKSSYKRQQSLHQAETRQHLAVITAIVVRVEHACTKLVVCGLLVVGTQCLVPNQQHQSTLKIAFTDDTNTKWEESTPNELFTSCSLTRQ